MQRGRPVELLCDISRGKKIRVKAQAGPGKPDHEYPDLRMRQEAAKILLGKPIKNG